MGRARRRMNDGGSLIVKSKRWLRLLPMFQFLVMVADLATTLQLTRMTFSAYGTSWTKDLNSGNFNLIFEKFAADLLGACILRLMVFPLFTHLGIKFGSTTKAADPVGGGLRCVPCSSTSDGLKEPLLPVLLATRDAVAQEERERMAMERATSSGWSKCLPFFGGRARKDGSGTNNKGLKEEREAEEALQCYKAVKRANRNKIAAESLVFFFSTGFQVYMGIKAVCFDVSKLRIHWQFPCLLLLGVICVNIESVLCCVMIESYAKEEGIDKPELHSHPLFFSKANAGHSCDLCRRRILRGYRCWLCDFDICMKCMSSSTKRAEGEGGIRGDKGVRNEKEVAMKPTEYLYRALKLASCEWHLLGCAFTCLILATGSNLVTPVVSGHVFNAIKGENRDEFVYNMKIFIGLSVGSGIFGSLKSLCFRLVQRKLSFMLRNRLFEGVIRQDIAFYDASQTGDLISRMSWDCNAMLQPVSNLLGTTLQSILFFFGGLVFSFFISWRLSMLAFTTMLPIIHLTSKYAVFSQRLNREIFTFIGMANSVAQEAMANIRTVRAFSTEDHELDRYRQETREALHRGIRDALANAGTIFLSNMIDYGASILILFYGGLLVIYPKKDRHINIGMLYAYLRFWDMIQTSYQSLQGVMNSFTKAAGAAQRVLSLMDSLPDIDPNSGRLAEDDMPWSVEFRNVYFVYQMRPDFVVLKDISLKMEPSEVCALVGPSGCGKTTLVSLILRYYDPTDGKILVGGRELQDFNLKHLHKSIGYVSQETQMFAKTIEENIGYGLEGKYNQNDLVEACKAANAHDFIMSFPSGYQTRIGERGVRLSGGQKQRIAIARMMLRRPKLLLLDEATSALDAESEALVQQSIDSLLEAQDRYTVVLVAHRLSTVVSANQICVIDKGVVSERGNHETLMKLEGTYARLVGKQLEKSKNMLYGAETEEQGSPGRGGGRGSGMRRRNNR